MSRKQIGMHPKFRRTQLYFGTTAARRQVADDGREVVCYTTLTLTYTLQKCYSLCLPHKREYSYSYPTARARSIAMFFFSLRTCRSTLHI